VPQGNGIRRSKDLRARFRKFLVLTNERKKMSKTTLRKRIALTVVSVLATGVLSSAPTANAHPTTVSTTAAQNAVPATLNNSQATLVTATELGTGGTAVVGALVAATTTAANATAKSYGLLTKDSSSGTAQTATMLVGGTLSLYASTGATAASTDVAFTASGGTFGITDGTGYDAGTLASPGYAQNQTRTVAIFDVNGATTVSQLWTAPTVAGTYVISYYTGTPTGDSIFTAPTQGTLSGRITVSVVATSSGGSYSTVYSTCATSAVSVVGAASNADSTATVTNGNPWYIGFTLKDGYNNNLDSGNVVATSTNGALIAYANAGSTPAAGTATTVVAFDAGSTDSIRVDQGTANAPMTTTVTISYNGTVVCTKTVSIRGEVAKIVVSDIATQDLSTGTSLANGSWLDDGTARTGMFRVLATDSAGSIVSTSTTGTYAAVSASLAGQTTVTSLTVDNSATSNSSTAPARYSTGSYACGATAGEVKTAQLQFTNTGTGTVIKSDAFSLRCADDPYTYTASWDKASYVQGELATLTVKFLDSKGNPANNVGSTGTWTGVQPMLTAVSATGSAPTLSNKGEKSYTFSVGTLTGITAGSYVSIIDFTSLTAVAATKQTPSYKVSTGGDSTTNADVLKSIVALIASINKQIQALQKLILKR
jgi:hypothetical protein